MADQTLARVVNERRVLTLLRIEGSLTRAEIGRRLSLTSATATHLSESLLARGLIAEDASAPTMRPRRSAGRPGILLRLAPDGGFFLGVEIGVGILRFAMLDMAVQVADTLTLEIDREMGPGAVVRLVRQVFSRFARKARFRDRILSTGITVPGLVRTDGFVVHLPILGWREVNLREMAATALPVPVIIENNANAAAFGEIYTRPDIRHNSIVSLKLGMGCGGAVVIDGRLLRGTSGTATELGHLHLTAPTRLCSCGRTGCLEPHVNLPALRQAWVDAADGDESAIEGPLLTLPSRIASLASRGDRRACAAIDTIAHRLGEGLVVVSNIFNPRSIVLGGAMRPVLASGRPVMERLLADGVVPGMMVPDIALGHLGEMECAIGVATIAHHDATDLSRLDLEADRITDCGAA